MNRVPRWSEKRGERRGSPNEIPYLRISVILLRRSRPVYRERRKEGEESGRRGDESKIG